MSRILVGIPTKDRDPTLGGTLFSLLQQTYKSWDLAIVNDGSREVGYSNVTKEALECIQRTGHRVWILPGGGSPAHNHNIVLYAEFASPYQWIFRADDDLPINRFSLERLLETATKHGAAAVGGLWFDVYPPEDFGAIGDRKEISTNPSLTEACHGRVDVMNSNWQQRMYHPNDMPQPVEHVYSNCLYDAALMREVGGWPEVYSKGVAHCEETDGTYRLHLAGYKLLVDPRVTGNHLRVGGGIRSKKNLKQVQSMDLLSWGARKEQIEQINFQPTVAVACPNHQYGIGGGQKLFYQTVSRLQQDTDLTVHAWFGNRIHFDPDQCESAFGFRYEEHEPLEEYDVGIVIGHDINEGVPAKHKIHYGLFPVDVYSENLRKFDAFLAISRYTQYHTEQFWKVKTEILYPPVECIGMGEGGRENIILLVSRCVPEKNPIWLMQQFIKMNMPEYTMHVVASSSVEDFDEYINQARTYAKAHPTIVWHENVTKRGLDQLYRRAKVLWSANGMMSRNPRACEHFGYTPVEAWSAGCFPVVYDKGGHQETVDQRLRWSTEEELVRITRAICDGDFDDAMDRLGLKVGDWSPVALHKFNYDFSEELENWIRRVNALAISRQHVEPLRIEGKIRVAMLGDGPYMPELGIGVTSGFGIVAGQIVQRMLECDDIELHYFGMEDNRYVRTDRALPFNYHPAIEDLEARKEFPRFAQWVNPDVIFIIYAPGDMVTRVQQLRMIQMSCPIVAYFPVEGAHRLNAGIPDLLKHVDYPVTYCKNGADLIEEKLGVRVPYAYHGADHADFKPLDPETREHIREILGWDGKYVVMTGGTNKRVKNYPVMIRALRLLLERGIDDVIFYFHTRLFDDHVLQGWDLGGMIDAETTEEFPVKDHIYSPMKGDKWHGVPFDETGIETWKLTKVMSFEDQCMLLSSLPLVTRYGLMDLYLDCSASEGHGLVSLEAAACGVPTVSVDDEMARSEIHSRYCHMLKPAAWDTWYTGTDLALLDPKDIAAVIQNFKLHPEIAGDGFEDNPAKIMEEMPWETTAQYFIDLIRKAANR